MQLLNGHDIPTVLTVSFEEEAYVVNENGGSEMFCFLITGELAPGVNATVNITAQPISAQGMQVILSICKC